MRMLSDNPVGGWFRAIPSLMVARSIVPYVFKTGGGTLNELFQFLQKVLLYLFRLSW